MKIQRFEKFINESIHENEIQDLTVVLNKTRKVKTALIEGLKKSIRSLIKEVYRWDIRDTLKNFTKWSDWKGEEMVIIDEKISRDIINFLYNGLDDFNNKQLSEIYVVLSTYFETNDNHCFDEFYDNLPQDFMNESNKNSNRKEGLLNQKVYQICYSRVSIGQIFNENPPYKIICIAYSHDTNESINQSTVKSFNEFLYKFN